MNLRIQNIEDTVRELVNLQLRKHGVDYDYVLENPMIDGQYWFSKYTLTEEESEKFEAEALEIIRDKLKCTVARARKEFTWFNLQWGLRVEYEN